MSDAPSRPTGSSALAAWLVVGLFRLMIPLAIVAAAVFVGRVIFRPSAPPERREREAVATTVETVTVLRDELAPVVDAFGTVQPARRIQVRPEVGGRVTELHPDLIAGGRVSASAELFTIDPREYEYRVAEQRSAVVRAEFDLTVEQGRGLVAEREWEFLSDSVERTELGERLARRQPHLDEATAAVDAARARLSMAELDLERTVVLAPFNALVLDESLEMGQLINAQTSAATLIGTDRFHVQVSVPLDRLGLLDLPAVDGAGGSAAEVAYDLGSRRVVRPGRLVRLLGDVDPAGRMARLLVAVDDPLGLRDAEDDQPPLLVGSFVEVRLRSATPRSVVSLPRQAVREGDRVWIMDAEDRLEVRSVGVVWGTDERVVVDAGLAGGERVIISPLATPVVGMQLRDVSVPATTTADAGPGAGR